MYYGQAPPQYPSQPAYQGQPPAAQGQPMPPSSNGYQYPNQGAPAPGPPGLAPKMEASKENSNYQKGQGGQMYY